MEVALCVLRMGWSTDAPAGAITDSFAMNLLGFVVYG
jgi:hypothetical protein